MDDSIAFMTAFDIPKTKWEKCFVWMPVIIGGKRYWFTHVYKRYLHYRGGSDIEYGTIFDIIKESE